MSVFCSKYSYEEFESILYKHKCNLLETLHPKFSFCILYAQKLKTKIQIQFTPKKLLYT